MKLLNLKSIVAACFFLVLCVNIQGQDIVTIEKSGQFAGQMKRKNLRENKDRTFSIKKLILKDDLDMNDERALEYVQIENVYIKGGRKAEFNNAHTHFFNRGYSGSWGVKYTNNIYQRTPIDTLFLTTAGQIQNYLCGHFDPKFIVIESTGMLILNKWTDDIKQIDQVDVIMSGAFAGTNIREVTIPPKVQYIPEFCFMDCTDLKSVTLNDSIVTINYGAFAKTKITNLTLPIALKHMGYDSFKDCKLEKCKLQTSVPPQIHAPQAQVSYESSHQRKVWQESWGKCVVEIPENSYADYKKDNFWNQTSLSENGGKRSYNIVIKKPGTILSHLPMSALASIDSLTITGFMYNTDMNVLKKCTSLKYIDLTHAFISESPESKQQRKEELEGISAYMQLMGATAKMAYKDKKISTVEYLATQGLTELGKSASEFKEADENCFIPNKSFTGLIQLKIAKLPLRAVSIGHYAFKDCSNLEYIELPPYVKAFGQEAFANCEKLRINKFPNTITKFYDGVFDNCTSLKKVDLSSCYMKGKFDLSIFDGTSLAELRLPNGIESVSCPTRSGMGNKHITANTTIYFPETFKALGTSFGNCHLHFQTQMPPKTSDSYISNKGHNNIIYVPKDCTTAYYSAFGDENSYKEE